MHGLTLEQQQTADPNYATRDLYDNIRAGHFPKWDLFVQVLTAARSIRKAHSSVLSGSPIGE